MEIKKTCPLLASCSDFPADRIRCTGHRCAWWDGDEASGRCVLISLADNAGELANSAAEIAAWTESISDTQQAAFEREHPRMARRPPDQPPAMPTKA